MVEDEIVKHYRSADGIWLVEKGKIKEAKLLKEAYERINSLNREYIRYRDMHSRGYADAISSFRTERDKAIAALEKQKNINKNLLRQYSSIRNAVAEIQLLSETVE